MYVEPKDNRPPTLLGVRPPDVTGVLVGLLMIVVSHVGIGGMVIAVGLFFGAEILAADEQVVEEEPPEMQFIEAKLVKLGRRFDPRELPNRQREARTTAPRRADVPRRDSKRVHIPPDAGITAADSVEDILARLGTRADEEARLARAAEQEGDPEGVEEGTHTREEGDVYISQLYAFFRRGFQMPPSIAHSERRGLRAVVRVQIAADGRVAGFSIQSSGNADFDQAVRLRLDQATGARIPEPPEERRAEFYGQTIPVAFVPPR